MRIITTQPDLDALCDELSGARYITVDTEFLRERTYWAQLCLIQVAPPLDWTGLSAGGALIDPIEGALDLAPLFALLQAPKVVKVFHAARQDIEIFHHLGRAIPAPLFDTQVAAMVCGFGDQVGYETLVRKVAGESLDKSSRFTDWSRRPLSDAQKTYALADVTHLRKIYERLSAQVAKAGRERWMDEEIQGLADPATYETEPTEAWRRLKLRGAAAKTIAAARALAEWREREAQERNLSRNRVLTDDALMEVAATRPRTVAALGKSRLLRREQRSDAVANAILKAIQTAEAAPAAAPPAPPPKPDAAQSALAELLRVMLKARASEIGVAPRLIASSADLDRLAMTDDSTIPALNGWRREAFGEDALRLKRGELALSAGPEGVRVAEIRAVEPQN